MQYNPELKAFHCHLCDGWKDIYTQVLVYEETDGQFVYCIIHDCNRIGTYDMVPEWRPNGPTDEEE
jgi:hypothetical protein